MTDHKRFEFNIDPELNAIWKKTGIPKTFWPRADAMPETRRLHALGTARFMKSAFVRSVLGPRRLWTEHDQRVVVRDGSSISVRIYRPTAHPHGRPVMVYSHSGGFCMGSVDSEAFICQLLCMKLGIIIVSVEYRLAPEWLHPTCVLDVYDVVKWVARDAKSFGGDLSKGFLTGGASGGGNLTCVSSMLALDDNLQPPLTGHYYLCTGMTHSWDRGDGRKIELFPDRLLHGSWEKYKDGPVGPRDVNHFYGVLADVNPSGPHCTPLKRPSFSGLGPVFYQIAEMDIWSDSALFYCEKLREAGEKTRIEVYPGVPHMWLFMWSELSINKKWARDLVDGVEWLLKQNAHGTNPSSRL